NNKVEEEPGELLALSTIVLLADKELNYNGNLRISFPSENSKTFAVSKTKTGYFAPAASDRLSIHPATGEVTQKDIFRSKPFNERVAGNIKALHVGNVFGGFSKLLYFITCLIATSLPVTGTIIWINKLKKRRKFRNRNILILQNSPAVV
ncbi:MAG: PepSY domain-containing protein, partial [Bacteroidetes bacterium]|nr:PepSY domain-containing protein [Bacteroidota bacterium]